MIRDITAFHELREAERAARRAEVIQRLAGGVAHDFNNLLTSILGNAHLILDTCMDGDRWKIDAMARDIADAALRAAELTRHMLAFAGKSLYFASPLELSDLVRELAPDLRALLPTNARLELALDPGLPTFPCDPSCLRDLIDILYRNAVEALTPSREGRIDIETGRCDYHQEVAVYLEVRDNGSGIPPEILPRIFEPFYSTKFPGRGLELAAADGMVSGCGGEIQVESRPGSGSAFRVILPVKRRAKGAKQ